MRILSNALSECAGIAHGFYTREGGVSEGVYASLNCGNGSDDDSESVAENRNRVAEHMGGKLVTQHQVHGKTVVQVETGTERFEADAMVTTRPGIALGILTADCGPVLFADPNAGIIGAAHAGWKGAVGGVLEATIDVMVALGAKRSQIIAAVGPTIRQRSYEVDAVFHSRFPKEDRERFFVSSPTQLSHFRFDLPGYIAARLAKAGLKKLDEIGMDTYSNEDQFYSFRRATHRRESDYGRQVSAIMLKK
ncbi:MAG: polyphenol oxidase [Rickettsiales bacterium]|nr:polyphenol oxidase [Rickettsiales bacterium]|tara:strand:- start:1744 stop:2493 length:750 start_codon:yes stop_codon:yes gene_type:complete